MRLHPYEMSSTGKSVETESRLGVARRWGSREWRVAAKGDGVSLLNVLEFDSSDNCTGFWLCQKPEINTL